MQPRNLVVDAELVDVLDVLLDEAEL